MPTSILKLETLSTSSEKPLFIPQNSGLRTVAPPKEFQNIGGFGSSRGSSFTNFGFNNGNFGSNSNNFGFGNNNLNRGFSGSLNSFSNFPSSTQPKISKG